MSFSIVLAVLLDLALGEPKRFHPLVGFGKMVRCVETLFRRSGAPASQVLMGGIAWGILVFPILAVIIYIQALLFPIGFSPEGKGSVFFFPLVYDFQCSVSICLNVGIVNIVSQASVLYLCIAHKSLLSHIRDIYRPLKDNNIKEARHFLSRVVSRDTVALGHIGVRKAAIESALENGSDAVFAPIFWFLIAGIPGVVLYRLANTLDAMWGYKNSRYLYFGRFAARIDDGLNWVPARLVAVSYALVGHFRNAIWAWSHQAALCSSPNAGPVMSAGAGALSVCIGGNAIYQGRQEIRPELGVGAEPVNADIPRALSLLNKTLLLWCVVIVFTETALVSLVLFYE